jgi:RHS repeat-associated protein
MAKANPLRFSTKYQDDETDLLYYGYRYYNASTGRWLSRDPMQERGGVNVYSFLSNDSVGYADFLGELRLAGPWWMLWWGIFCPAGFL